MRLYVHVETPVPIFLKDVVCSGAGSVFATLDSDISGGHDRFTVKTGQTAKLGPPSVGEDNVQTAHLVDGLANKALDVISAGQVGLDGTKGASLRICGQARQALQVLDQRLGPLLVAAVIDDDPVAVLGKESGSCGAEPGTTGCNESNGG